MGMGKSYESDADYRNTWDRQREIGERAVQSVDTGGYHIEKYKSGISHTSTVTDGSDNGKVEANTKASQLRNSTVNFIQFVRTVGVWLFWLSFFFTAYWIIGMVLVSIGIIPSEPPSIDQESVIYEIYKDGGNIVQGKLEDVTTLQPLDDTDSAVTLAKIRLEHNDNANNVWSYNNVWSFCFTDISHSGTILVYAGNDDKGKLASHIGESGIFLLKPCKDENDSGYRYSAYEFYDSWEESIFVTNNQLMYSDLLFPSSEKWKLSEDVRSLNDMRNHIEAYQEYITGGYISSKIEQWSLALVITTLIITTLIKCFIVAHDNYHKVSYKTGDREEKKSKSKKDETSCEDTNDSVRVILYIEPYDDIDEYRELGIVDCVNRINNLLEKLYDVTHLMPNSGKESRIEALMKHYIPVVRRMMEKYAHLREANLNGVKMDGLKQEALESIKEALRLIEEDLSGIVNDIYYDDIIAIMSEAKAIQAMMTSI